MGKQRAKRSTTYAAEVLEARRLLAGVLWDGTVTTRPHRMAKQDWGDVA